MALAKKTKYHFAFIRQMVDILAIFFTLVLTFSLDVPMTAREGTVIGMLIFAPLMGFFIKRLQPIINLKTEKAV